jgi:predicted Rossmann fold nucleotide-binding protein DprA/Smf involved in DNA uptake
MHDDEWQKQLDLIRAEDPDAAEKLGRLLDKGATLREDGNVYGERYSARQLALSFGAILATETQRARILRALRAGPRSVTDVARELELDPERVLADIVELRRRNRVGLHHIEDRTPLYYLLVQEGG